jgi:hypothetical protein
MKLSYLLLGFAAIFPASVLLFSLIEFNILKVNGGFFPTLSGAVWVSFISVWSVYSMSVGNILKNKKIPTSLEGLWTSAYISIGYAIGLLCFEYFIVHVDFTLLTLLLTFFGVVAAGAVQGFYIGFTKARLGDDEAKGFVLRQIGLIECTLLLTPFVFITFKSDDEWVMSYSFLFLLVTSIVLAIHFTRAKRQSKNFLTRRNKKRSEYSVRKGQADFSKPTLA